MNSLRVFFHNFVYNCDSLPNSYVQLKKMTKSVRKIIVGPFHPDTKRMWEKDRIDTTCIVVTFFDVIIKRNTMVEKTEIYQDLGRMKKNEMFG